MGSPGMLVEEMASGVELIAGAMIDYQFGPMILLGMGGTGVEIYKDVSLRMAPVTEKDVPGMVADLKARALLEGYRGSEPVDIDRLAAAVAILGAGGGTGRGHRVHRHQSAHVLGPPLRGSGRPHHAEVTM